MWHANNKTDLFYHDFLYNVKEYISLLGTPSKIATCKILYINIGMVDVCSPWPERVVTQSAGVPPSEILVTICSSMSNLVVRTV